jgi:hypothetical protein
MSEDPDPVKTSVRNEATTFLGGLAARDLGSFLRHSTSRLGSAIVTGAHTRMHRTSQARSHLEHSFVVWIGLEIGGDLSHRQLDKRSNSYPTSFETERTSSHGTIAEMNPKRGDFHLQTRTTNTRENA